MTQRSIIPVPARLVIADDHEVTRVGLRGMLADEPALKIVGEASDGHHAIELCQQLRPDLALLDVRMPKLDGIRAAQAIRQRCPSTRVLLISNHDAPEYLAEAARAGVGAYLLKDTSRHQLLNTIRQLLRGEQLLHEVDALSPSTPAGRHLTIPEPLTPRELDVLRMVARGLTNRAIANELRVSPGTVKSHVEHLISKLGVSDRTEAAVYALRAGLLSPD